MTRFTDAQIREALARDHLPGWTPQLRADTAAHHLVGMQASSEAIDAASAQVMALLRRDL